MNYKDYNDYEILSYVAEANGEAIDVMFDKYKPLIQTTANRMYCYCKNTGLEYNDLIQEGMLGLNLAIHTFESNKETSFYTYAKMCIERKIISAVIAANRNKNKILNDSISYDDEENSIINFIKDSNLTPEEKLLDDYKEEDLLKNIRSVITDFEDQVLVLLINGFKYKEIADMLDKDKKSIDNAIQRLKMKIRKIIEKD